MARWNSLKDALAASLRNWQLWLVQFFGNAALFVVFVSGVRVPDAHLWQVLSSLLLIAMAIGGALLLHGGTLNYLQSACQDNPPLLAPAFKKALKHLAAIALWAAIFFLLRWLINKLDHYGISFPGYLRSEFPSWLRRMISESSLDNIYSGFVFLLRWVVLPGLLLPFALFSADRGFSGLIAFRGWGRTIRSVMYWGVLLIAVILGVYCVDLIMGWKLDPKTATLSAEKTSLVLRLLFAYLLGIFSWLLICSTLGRRQPAASGQAGAQPQ